MFVLYQSGGVLLACAEEIDGCLEELEGYLDNHPAPMAEDGRPLGIEDYLDFTMVQTPGLEVSGELYLRRCTLALFEAWTTNPDYGSMGYQIRHDGTVNFEPRRMHE